MYLMFVMLNNIGVQKKKNYFVSGFINTKGMTFRKGTEKHTMVSVGPITKFAEDLTPVVKALLGPEKSLELKIDQVVIYYYLILILCF